MLSKRLRSTTRSIADGDLPSLHHTLSQDVPSVPCRSFMATHTAVSRIPFNQDIFEVGVDALDAGGFRKTEIPVLCPETRDRHFV